MAVGIELGSITDEIGTAEFLLGFFSTVAANLEPGGWGTRFPVVMNRLYAGTMEQREAAGALAELDAIHGELSALPVARLVWDIDDRSKIPPWGDNIADTITSLGNYFVTSTGRDLITLLREVLEELHGRGGIARIVKL